MRNSFVLHKHHAMYVLPQHIHTHTHFKKVVNSRTHYQRSVSFQVGSLYKMVKIGDGVMAH